MSDENTRKGWLGAFSSFGRRAVPPTTSAAPQGTQVSEISTDYQPTKGTFFQTQEYPVTGADNAVIGKNWMEAGYNPANSSWVLWKKSITRREDVLMGGEADVLSSQALFEKTNFVNAFDQMITFEMAQKSLEIEPLQTKTPAKLAGDYVRQFAWREGLIISRSGKLYPYTEGQNVQASNYFDVDDIKNATSFLERVRAEEYTPVPLSYPSTDWEKFYATNQARIEDRLRAVMGRYGNDQNNFDLAVQMVRNEAPEILYGHIRKGFKPAVFHSDPQKHFALVKAAIDNNNIETIDILSHAGLSFLASAGAETSVHHALQNKRYSHLHVMIGREGSSLANYCSTAGMHPAIEAMMLQDRQSFRALYVAGYDFDYADSNGWRFVHHGFDQNFMPCLYAWLAEGHNLDEPIAGTIYTGVSIAKRNEKPALIKFAVEHGANADAPIMTAAVVMASVAGPGNVEATPLPQSEFAQKIAAAVDALDQEPQRSDLKAQMLNLVAQKKVDDLVEGLTVLAQHRAEASDKAGAIADFLHDIAQTPLPSKHLMLFHILNSDIPNANVERIFTVYANAGGTFDSVDGNGDIIWETCWRNQKAAAELNRRNIIPVLGKLGIDPAQQVSIGTTQLVKSASGATLDLDFIKALAPFVRDPNQGDTQDNNILHALQLNANEQVGRSANIDAVRKLFPNLDLNHPNMDGYSAIGLAIRLDRTQTLKLIPTTYPVDLGQTTASGWSYFDMAFTEACALARVAGAPRADRISSLSDGVKDFVLAAMERATGEPADRMRARLNRTRPDNKTLLTAMIDENAPAQTIGRLVKSGLVANQADGRGIDPRQQVFQAKRTDLISILNAAQPPQENANSDVVRFPTRTTDLAQSDGGSPMPQ